MKQNLVGEIIKALEEKERRKPKAYDTSATVTRIDGDTAWVHIPSGVGETPVKLTINAKAGDTVQVRVSGGKAFMVGNASAPPTDDTVAQKAVGQVRTISKVVEKVRQVAETASRIAGNTNQYFWHTQEGIDTGAHITEIPQDEFLADPTKGGGNTLIRSNGVAVRDGLTELSTFSANGCYLGNETTSRLLLNNVGVTGMTDTGIETFKIVAGDYSGTQTITETTGIVENTASDKSAMNTFYRAQQTPSASTTVTYTINAVVEFRGYTKNTNLQFSYMYDPDDMTISTAGSGSVMMFPNGYVYVACDVQYPVYAVNMSFALTASNGGTIQNAQISVSMLIPDPVLPSYTFGLRSGTRAEEGAYSFAGGTQNIASGEASSVFGVENVVGGMGSASFGSQNTVTGNYGLASGQGNIVTGDKATAFGNHLLAYTSHQTVLGHYNVGDGNNKYALIVGNGDASDRSNAFTIDWDGDVVANRHVTAGSRIYTNRKTAAGDGVEGAVLGDGALNLVRNGNPAIYFYRNNATSRTSYFAETSNGCLTAEHSLQAYEDLKAGGKITAGAVQAYTPTWASGHTAADYHCVVSAGICSFSYRGPTVAHAANTTICTLPAGARPKAATYAPFVKMSGGAVGCMRIFTTGVVEVMLITDTSSTGRLYFNCTFPVV